jgi:hypothetical protein
MTVRLQPKTPPTPGLYDRDILAWAQQQAGLLRAGRLAELDIQHIAEEIEDVGKSEQRELASRMAVLLVHLLKWQYQPERRGNSRLRTLRAQRRSIALRLRRTPSLKPMLRDPDWLEEIWQDAIGAATADTGLDAFPEDCPWSVSQCLDTDWLPQ